MACCLWAVARQAKIMAARVVLQGTTSSTDKQYYRYHTNTVSKKNRPTKGQISLVSQIAAQGTKVNSWENSITKVDILSFVPPKYRSLVSATDL